MARPTTIDEYIMSQPEKFQKSLEELRTIITSIAPEAEESMSYGIACYKLHYMFVGFSAHTNHFSFTAMSNSVFDKFKDELEEYDTTVGSIRFKAGETIPIDLITKIILERKAENEIRASFRKSKSKSAS